MSLDRVIDYMSKNKMFKAGEVIGVGVSGGIDSMALLHFLNSIKEDKDIEIVAITVDHQLREESAYDCAFVQSYCKRHGIRCYKFKVDCASISKNKGLTIEEGAREGRYGVFENMVKNQMVDKIALAHHMQDQAETILFHLLRGSGTAGLKGMEPVRDFYIRPFLETEKSDIVEYAYENEIPYVDDASNDDVKYNRNFLRHKIFPLLRSKWPGVDKTICSFASLAKEDDEFIGKFAQNTSYLTSKNVVKLPVNYFVFDKPVVSRAIFKALQKIDATKDVESKHISMITSLANAENGTSIDLPNRVKAIKEYEYIAFVKPEEKKPLKTFSFKTGKLEIENVGKITVKKQLNLDFGEGFELVDCKKIPKDAVWRKRAAGDEINKLGGGRKSLKDFLIEKKIPARDREHLPVLASGKNILVVAGVGISNDVKVDETTTCAYKITFESKN